MFSLCQKQTFRGPYKFNDQLHQNLTKRNININSVFNKFYVTQKKVLELWLLFRQDIQDYLISSRFSISSNIFWFACNP